MVASGVSVTLMKIKGPCSTFVPLKIENWSLLSRSVQIVVRRLSRDEGYGQSVEPVNTVFRIPSHTCFSSEVATSVQSS